MRMKTILCSMMAFLLLLSGCRLLPSSPPEETPDPTAYISQFRNNWYYSRLDEKLQACYGAIYTALVDTFSTDEEWTYEENGQPFTRLGVQIKLPCVLDSQEEARRLYDLFCYDNPRFFYLANQFSLKGYSVDGQPQYTHMSVFYTMTASERAKAKTAIEHTVQQWVDEAPDTDDPYEIELYLHDRLASTCVYHDDAAADLNAYPTASSAYGALIENKAVCGGFAQAMKLLLDEVDIPSTQVTGISAENGERHIWNLVTINGCNYHVDVTWDSGSPVHHSFFNMTTEQLLNTHQPDADQPGLDTCTATADNYYIRCGTYIDTYERQAIARIIADAVADGKEFLELRTTPDKYDNALLFLKNTSLTKQTVNAYLLDNDQVMWSYQLRGRPESHIIFLERTG